MEIFRLIRHNRWVLVLSAVLGLAAGALFSFTQPVLYSATSSGYVVAGRGETVGAASAAMTLAQSKAEAYVPLVNSKSVGDAIAQKVGPLDGVSLSAYAVEGSPVFRIVVVAPGAEQARTVADAAMEATSTEALRLESMGADGTSTMQSIVRLVHTEATALPVRPISPNWTINLAVGLAAGVAAGLCTAFVRRGIDGRIRTQEDAEDVTESSVLGIIPKEELIAKEQGTRTITDRGATAEALRLLRTNLQFVSVDDPPRTVVVTSANASEGKSTVAANLARVLAQSGQPVILVDADLRRPTQGSRFGVEEQVGLTSVLAGRMTLDQVLQPTSVPNLRLLPAGRVPPNPSELVGSRRMAQVLAALSQHHLVIIDAPPMLPVTDAGLLISSADGALLVLRVGKTQKEQIRQVMRLIRNVNGRLLGSVLNMTPRRAMATATYGYGFGGYGTGYERDYESVREPNRVNTDD